MKEELKKAKYIVWSYQIHEGWSPTPYETLEQAVSHQSYGIEIVITRGAIDYKVTAVEES